MDRLKPNGKGRVLLVEDVQAMLPLYRGKPRSRWWVTHSFAPDDKHMLGRQCWWWEADAVRWLDGQYAETARRSA